MNKTNQNLETMNSIHKLHKKMEELLKNNCLISDDNGKSTGQVEIDLLQVVKNEEVYKSFNDELIRQTDIHKKFWVSFMLNPPNIKEVYSIAGVINKQTKLLLNKWDKIIKGYYRKYPIFNFWTIQSNC